MIRAPKNAPRVASFFAGAGGLDIGFAEAGFDVVYATDHDPDCCQTLRMNVGKSVSSHGVVEQADIRELDLGSLPTDIDLVIGGPPCQSFSASGRRAGGAAGSLDSRGTLFRAYKDCVAHLKPKAFVFENVRGIFSTNKGQDWRDVVTAFREIGYHISFRILDAADFGIPQHRERVFLVGTIGEQEFRFPRPTHGPDSPGQRPYISPEEAFAAIKNPAAELPSLSFEGGRYSHLLKQVPEGQNYLFFTAQRGYPSPIFAYRSRFSDFLYKAARSYPMKTIIASPGKYTGPLHWENRYFSLSEYKAIQGFPQDYRFFGDRASAIRQIGNSVSPKIAFRLAQAVAAQVFEGKAIDLLSAAEPLTFDKRKGEKAATTRLLHKQIASSGNRKSAFVLKSYTSLVTPSALKKVGQNCVAAAVRSQVTIDVKHDSSGRPFCSIDLAFWEKARTFSGKPAATVRVNVLGNDDAAIQTAWNAVDDWLIRSSGYHSLFEAYGHFTEPYPIFKVTAFSVFSDSPVLRFAKTISDFRRCSVYLEKAELRRLLGGTFGSGGTDEAIARLRGMRFDIRTKETNIAIPENKYMIAYPFTLPLRKQMNFQMKHTDTPTPTSYIAGVR